MSITLTGILCVIISFSEVNEVEVIEHKATANQ